MPEERSLITRELAELVRQEPTKVQRFFTILESASYAREEDKDNQAFFDKARREIEELRQEDPLLDAVCAGVTTYSRELSDCLTVDFKSLDGILRFLFPKKGNVRDLRMRQLQAFLDTEKYFGSKSKDGAYVLHHSVMMSSDDHHKSMDRFFKDISADGVRLKRAWAFYNAAFMSAIFGGIRYAGTKDFLAFPEAFAVIYALTGGIMLLHNRMSKKDIVNLGAAVDDLIHKIIPESKQRVVTLGEKLTVYEQNLLSDIRRLQHKKRHRDAISPLEQAIANNLHCSDLHYELGNCHLALGNVARAEEHYARAVAIQSKNNISAHKKLAEIYLGGKRYDDAVSLLERAVRTSPFDSDVYTLLFKAYIGAEKPIEVLARAERLKKLSPLTLEQKQLQMQACFMHYAELINAGNYQHAEILWRKMINDFKKGKKLEEKILIPVREAYMALVRASSNLGLDNSMQTDIVEFTRAQARYNLVPGYDFNATNLSGRIVLGLMGYFYGGHFGNETVGKVLGLCGAFLPEVLRAKNFVLGDLPYYIKTSMMSRDVARRYKQPKTTVLIN